MTGLLRSLAVAGVLVMAVAGCASSTETDTPRASVEDSAQGRALAELVEAERATIPAVMESAPGMYSDVAISAIPPGEVEYLYVYEEALDPAAAAEYFDSMVETFQSLCDEQIFPAMAEAGVTSERRVTYRYLNPDKSLLWEKTFEPS